MVLAAIGAAHWHRPLGPIKNNRQIREIDSDGEDANLGIHIPNELGYLCRTLFNIDVSLS